MASNLENPVDMSYFKGRNGFTNPTRLIANGNFTGEAKEQKGFKSDKDILETTPGDELYGNEISATKRMIGLDTWEDTLVSVNDTSSYIYDTDDFYPFGEALTTDLPTSFLEYYDELFLSNGTDEVRRCVKTNVDTVIAAIDTTIILNDAHKFLNDVGKVYIEGDEIDYIGVSAGTIISKAFGDSPYTATAVEKTINIDTSGGAFTLVLPTAVGVKDTVYIIRKSTGDANTVTIDPDGTETIDHALTKSLTTLGASIVIQSDGTNWVISTLSFAGANILDNVTNIAEAHAVNKIVIQSIADSDIPKGRALEEYLGKFWLAKVPAEPGSPLNARNAYFSASGDIGSPELFYTFIDPNSISETEVAANYTATAYDVNIKANATSTAFTITLPPAAIVIGEKFRISKIDNTINVVTVVGDAAETIDGVAGFTLDTLNDIAYIESDGVEWVTVAIPDLGSGLIVYPNGGNTTALLNYSGALIVSQTNKVEIVNGFDFDQFPPAPKKQNVDNKTGAVNEDCLVKMAGDVVYFTSDRRIKRLFQPDGTEGVRQLDGFDLPVLDILEKLDTDQSEAAMIYNERERLLYLSVKTKGSLFNNLRIVYSTDNQSWWIQENMFCRKYAVLDGKLYYGHSITGRVIKDDSGFTHDGFGVVRKYESMHAKFREQRLLWTHHYFEGTMTPNSIATIQFYVNNNLFRTVTLDSEDITQSGNTNQAAVGDGVVADTMWGSGQPPLQEISPLRRYQKWVSLGKKGQQYHYTIEMSGKGERLTLDTSVCYTLSESKASRLQSTS